MERQDISGIEFSRTFNTDALSRDHHWGQRVQPFLEPSDQKSLSEKARGYLANNLPYTILGYPTNFASPDPNDNGIRLLDEISDNTAVLEDVAFRSIVRSLYAGV